MKTLFGGSESKSTQSGFNQLPASIRSSFSDLATGAKRVMQDPNAFKPMPTTADEESAFSMIRGRFTPTAATLGADMSMLMNPYQSSVINEINRQGQGEFSMLNQAMNQAGQFGSNRGILGANDIDLSRMNQIGSFLTNQYNTNLGYAMNQLPQLRQQDAAGMLGIGEFQRGLDTQNRQANVNALMAAAQIMGVLPKSEGGGTSTGSQQGGVIPGLRSLFAPAW